MTQDLIQNTFYTTMSGNAQLYRHLFNYLISRCLLFRHIAIPNWYNYKHIGISST